MIDVTEVEVESLVLRLVKLTLVFFSTIYQLKEFLLFSSCFVAVVHNILQMSISEYSKRQKIIFSKILLFFFFGMSSQCHLVISNNK